MTDFPTSPEAASFIESAKILAEPYLETIATLGDELARTEHDLAVAVAEATTARAEVERLKLQLADVCCAECRAGWDAEFGPKIERLTADRDALAARLQAVRDAAGSLLAALDEQQWCDYGDHTGMTWEDCALVEASEYALRAALDASLGTPGDERREWPKVHPKATRERATFPLDVPPPNLHLAARSCCGDSHFGDGCDPEARAEYESGTPGDEKPPELPVEPLSVGDVKRVWTDAIQQVAASDGSYTVEIGGVAITKAGGGKPQQCEPESMVWGACRCAEKRGLSGCICAPCGCDGSQDHQRAGAEQIVAWVNANGGEARYVPNGEDTPIGWSGYPRIAIRTAYGWAYAKPGDRIVKGDEWFDFIQTKPGMLPDEVRLREFTVSPVESSGSTE